jgi:hypothetical protein
VAVTTKPNENPNILVLRDSSSFNFDDGIQKYMEVFMMEILIPNYYVLHS